MINLYFTLKLLIPVVIILAVILTIVILAIKRKLDSRFKQNCYECKHYRLFDVASCGGRCRYKCGLKNQIKNDIQDNYDSICGAKIIIKDNIKGLEKNQCKINYSDWSYKIITIC